MNNKNTILSILVLIAVMVLSLVALSKEEVINEEYHRVYNAVNEIGDLNKYITTNNKALKRIIINSYLNNNSLDDIEIFDNRNKILYAFEQYINNDEDKSKFIVIDNKSFNLSKKDPLDDGVLSYMYAVDFSTYYNKTIHEKFNINDKEVSTYGTEFDKNDIYVYYKRINGKYGIESIIATNSRIDDNYIITTELLINFNNDLKKVLNKDSIKADIKYTYLENDELKILSIKTKTSN